MNNLMTLRNFPHNGTAFEQICVGLAHLRKKEVVDHQLVLKMHDGMAKVIAGQMRIVRAFQLAGQPAA